MIHEPVHPVAQDQREDHDHQHAPVGGAPFLQLDGGRRLEDVGGRDRVRRTVSRIVLLDQLVGIEPDNPRDAPDVPPGVEIAAASGEVAVLDPPDYRLPDAGSLTDLRNGETSLAARLRQGITNAHGAPPLLDGTDTDCLLAVRAVWDAGAATEHRGAPEYGNRHQV